MNTTTTATTTPRVRVGPILTLAAALTATALIVTPWTPGPRGSIAWALALAAMFVLAERTELRVGTGRTHTVTLTEIPLIIGLVFTGAVSLVAARLAASLITSTRNRRGHVKTTYNAAVHLLEIAVAARVFSVMTAETLWLPALAAAVCSTVAGIAAVQLAVALHGARSTRSVVRAASVSVTVTITSALGAAAVIATGAQALIIVLTAAAALGISSVVVNRQRRLAPQ